MDDSEGGDASSGSRTQTDEFEDGRQPSRARQTRLPGQPSDPQLAPIAARPDAGGAPAPDAEPEAEGRGPSLLDALHQQRTTLLEVGNAARRLSLVVGLSDARHVVRQLLLAFALGLTLALMVALLFAGGTLRLVLGVLVGTSVTALGVFGALRGVSKLAERYGARSLPGSPWLWVGSVVLVAVGGTAAFSFSVWQVTRVATAKWTPAAPKSSISAASSAGFGRRAADAHMKRDAHIGLERGVLYAPPDFKSKDGQFDLVLHYHGNVELIEQSLAAAKLNAIVAIINVGDGADKYSRALQNPFVFDRTLTTIEARAQKRLGLENAQIRRIALSAWSAGFASVNQILSSRSRLDRVDAVFLLDAPHAKYAPFHEPDVYVPSLEHYLSFARRALAGQKLMVITHSAIQTEGYPSTTRTTDALLEQLGLERKPAPDKVRFPPVDLPVAKRAFPDGERNWLEVVSLVHEQQLYVYGCSGNGKGDHIAHLAQMSVTVLPLLKERWR